MNTIKDYENKFRELTKEFESKFDVNVISVEIYKVHDYDRYGDISEVGHNVRICIENEN